MLLDFSGTTVAVTGAAIGIGHAIALRFAELRANVYACDIRTDTFPELHRHGIVCDHVDLSRRDNGAAWIESVHSRAGGAADVLVNNVGGVAGQSAAPIELVTDAAWDQVIAINLNAAFALCRSVAPGMKQKGSGAIVNISSNSALGPTLTGLQAYCAAKHAVLGLTRQLAHELGPFGIRVNSVAPGLVRTNEMTERQWQGYGATGQKAMLQSIALRRLGTSEEMANVVVFLASTLASFVNGQIISVDGGK